MDDIVTEILKSLKEEIVRSQEAIAKLDTVIHQCKNFSKQVERRKKEVDNKITESLAQLRQTLLAKNEEIRLQKITGLEMQVSELQMLRDGLNFASEKITAAQFHTASQQLSTKSYIQQSSSSFRENIA